MKTQPGLHSRLPPKSRCMISVIGSARRAACTSPAHGPGLPERRGSARGCQCAFLRLLQVDGAVDEANMRERLRVVAQVFAGIRIDLLREKTKRPSQAQDLL